MIVEWLEMLAAWPPALALKESRYAYPLLNAAHIVSLAVLFGSILVLDLRLLGYWRNVPLGPLAVFVPRVSALGFVSAAMTGFLLFSVQPLDYAFNIAFRVKLVLIALALIHVASVHLSHAWRDAVSGMNDITLRLRLAGAMSLVLWASVIVTGRFIAFI